MKYILLACLLLLSFSQVTAQPDKGLHVSEAWVRAMPPGSKMTAAYAKISNNSDEDVEITGFSSPQYYSVSLHQTMVDANGMSSMVEIPRLLLSAGESVDLEPGGKHLMLMSGIESNPTKVEINLLHKDGSSTKVEFSIEKRQ